MRKLALLFAVLLALCPFAALGEAGSAVTVEDQRTQIGENFVAYPRLAGMADEAIQTKINDDVLLGSDAARHLVTLATLGDSPWGLRVGYEASLIGEIYSVALSAKGKQPNGRNGHTYTALTYDLRTGERLAMDDLFADVAGAVTYMEESLAASFAEEISGYYQNGELTPLPVDSFTVDADGVTFWYPYEQFAFLSEYAGACQFGYWELADYLVQDADGAPARLGALPKAYAPEETKIGAQKAVAEGALPHVPVKLGDGMADVIAAYRLLRTPDEYPGGRYFRMEDARLRDVLVISDTMQSGWDASRVEGLRVQRGELYGLVVGKSVREDWIKAFGEPDEVIEFTEGMAYDYSLPMGRSDLYLWNGRELRLHADESGVLRSIQLHQ